MRIAAEPSPRTDDYPFRHAVRVRFAETDAMGIVHHSRYLPLLEEARVAYLRRLGHPYGDLRASGIDFTVLEAWVQYRQPLRFDDVVDIHTVVARTERASFQMAYALTVAGELRATAVTAHGCVTADGRPTRLPRWFVELGDPPRLTTDRLAVELAPSEGGRVAQIRVDGVELLVGRAAGDEPDTALSWGSYPMVPWAGRIRRGRFSFDGAEYELPINFGEHAIHGVGVFTPWTVTEQTATAVRLELELPTDHRWPFGGKAHQTISVRDATLRCELGVTAGERAMPVALGWHPWLRKPDWLRVEPEAMYRRDDDGIAVDELVEVPPGPWDDCFVVRGAVTLCVAGVELELRSGCTDWVIYDMPAHATCVEPQTAPPDAFTIRPHRLAPGEQASSWFELEARAAPRRSQSDDSRRDASRDGSRDA